MTPLDRDDAMDDGAPVHPDIALITDVLAKEATQEQIDEVARRLRDDEAFRDNTALVIAAWKVPPLWQREPMPPGMVAKDWSDFAKRAGFARQRRTARLRTVLYLGVAFLALGIAALLFRGRIHDAYVERRDFDVVGKRPGTFILADDTQVQLGAHSRLLVRKKQLTQGFTAVKLYGSARFLVRRPAVTPSSSGGTMQTRVLGLMLSVGTLITPSADFSVSTHGDTADIQVFRRARSSPPASYMDGETDFVLARSTSFPLQPQSIAEDERGAVYRNAPARRFVPPLPSDAPPDFIKTERDTAKWRTLLDSTRVLLEPGAELRVDSARDGNVLKMTLRGSARFQMRPFKLDVNMMPPTNSIAIVTGGATIGSLGADFWVRARGDTTDVEVLDRKLTANVGTPVALAERVLLFSPDPSNAGPPMLLHSGERGRLIAGNKTP